MTDKKNLGNRTIDEGRGERRFDRPQSEFERQMALAAKIMREDRAILRRLAK